MRKWIDATIAGLAMWVASTTVMAADEIGYQAVDLANRETISGKMLVIVANAGFRRADMGGARDECRRGSRVHVVLA